MVQRRVALVMLLMLLIIPTFLLAEEASMWTKMYNTANTLVGQAVGLVWYWPVVILCLFGGLFFTLRLGFIQIRCFPHAVALLTGKYDSDEEEGHISHFEALSAALSGTVGLGNIAGVAIAIALGGPGAVFWMWMIGILGMATKYTECGLATHFREKDPETKEVRGGPMYYITKGLGDKWQPLATFFAICVTLACFGGGNMFQSNQVASALSAGYSIPTFVTGTILAIMVAAVIIGGIERIGSVASKIVPLMCVIYVLGAITVCLLNVTKLGDAFNIIFTDAFSGHAAVGGVVGSVIIMGVRRAVFSSESGLGSAAIAHSAVQTNYPIREGIVASLEPFIDTVVVCTATALVIVLSGLYGTEGYAPRTLKDYEQVAVISSFEEKEAQPKVQGNWKVSKEKPERTSSILEHINGDRVLAYSGGEASSTVTIPALSVVSYKAKMKDGKFDQYEVQKKDAKDKDGKPVKDKDGKVIQEVVKDKDGNPIKVIDKIYDGIRFSSYRDFDGTMTVELLDSKGNTIALSETKTEKDKEPKEVAMTLVGADSKETANALKFSITNASTPTPESQLMSSDYVGDYLAQKTEDEKTKQVKYSTVAKVNATFYTNKWESHVIKFGAAVKSQIKKSNGKLHELSLRFTLSGKGKWYIDRVQVVSNPPDGVTLTTSAFDRFIPGFGSIFITLAIFLFAFSTAITWSYYGETGAAYLMGNKVILPFKWIFVVCVFLGAVLKLDLVLNFSDLTLGLMVIPNTIAILLLSGTAASLTKDYFQRLKAGEFDNAKDKSGSSESSESSEKSSE